MTTRGLSENEVKSQVVDALEKSGATIYRNNIGCAKMGKRFIRYGVGGSGGSDLIGFVPVTVTPDMVGKRLAVFLAVETKREKGGAKTEAQEAFIENIRAFGGLAGFARCWADALSILRGVTLETK